MRGPQTFAHRDASLALRGDAEEVLLSVVVPCFNERNGVADTLGDLERVLAGIGARFEIIVVDDGSNDGSSEALNALAPSDVRRVIRHSVNRGYGAALKTGIRSATGRYIAITDADGTYPNDRIPDLLARAVAGADMVVGARVGADVIYSKLRAIPKAVMRRYCIWLTRQPIPDMNSGLRVFRRDVAGLFLNLLPNAFSFTTTITIAMMINGYQVEYVPISYRERIGSSKISPIKDTIRFVQLIIRAGLYFAPLRVFAPLIFVLWTAFFVLFIRDFFFLSDIGDGADLLLNLATTVTVTALLADMIDKRLR